jgi:predicted CXXCH cytochrome family protein
MWLRFVAWISILLIPAAAAAAAPNTHNTLDCLFCHDETPRFGVDTRETVGFYRYDFDDPRLCYVCHDKEENLHPVGIQPEDSTLQTRSPKSLPLGASEGREDAVVCTTCHFIHAANSDFALLRGFPGSQQPGLFYEWQQLCRQCHGNMLERRSPHAGDERACAFCHAVRPEEGQQVDILPQGVALCNFCHGSLQKDHTKGINPFAGEVDCLTCHDPHLGPDRPGRLKSAYYDYPRGTVTIDPHLRRTPCSVCHIEEKTFTLITRNKDSLCTRCHDSPQVVGDIHPIGPPPDGMTVPAGWPLYEGRVSCLTCHVPGHQEDLGRAVLLRGGPYENRRSSCAPCHDFSAMENENPHAAIAKLQGCDTCHDRQPVFGKDTSQTVTFKASINLLCLRCHEDTPHPGGLSHTMPLEGERAASAPYYYPLDRYSRITCATCHNPHESGKENLLLREPLAGMEICSGCHSL